MWVEGVSWQSPASFLPIILGTAASDVSERARCEQGCVRGRTP